MINLPVARQIALKHLRVLSSQMEVELGICDIEENEDHFCVFFNSKEWIETRNLSASLAGNTPFLIDRNTGKIVER